MLQKIIRKYRSKNTYWCLLLIVMIINSIIFFALINKEKTIVYEGHKLVYQERTNGKSIFKDEENNILTVKSEYVEFGNSMTITDEDFCSYEIVYQGKEMFYDNSNFMELSPVITLFDGSQYQSSAIDVAYANKETSKLPAQVKLAYDAIEVHKNMPGINSHIADIVVGIISIAFGLFQLIYAERVWKFRHTDIAIKGTKILGIVFMLMPSIAMLYRILFIY